VSLKLRFRMVVLVALSLVAAACGGSNSEGTTTSQSASVTTAAETTSAPTTTGATTETTTEATTEATTETTTAELPTVRISGLERGMAGVAIKAMEENGFDRSNGFVGEFTYLGFDALEPDFLQGGSDVTFGVGDPIALATARVGGFDVSGFMPYLADNICIVVLEDSPYQEPADLVGARVGHFGVNSGTTSTISILLQEYFDIDIFSDFELIEAGKPALVELLQQGEIDAMMNSAPDTSRGVAQGGRCLFGPVVQEMTERGGELSSILSSLTAFNDWLCANQETAKSVAAAWGETHAWMMENPEFISQSPFVEVTGQEDPVVIEQLVREVTETPIFLNGWETVTIDGLHRFADLAAAQGNLIEENPGGLYVDVDQLEC
jgi:NitT/TauT family transport system substrate-binding protein